MVVSAMCFRIVGFPSLSPRLVCRDIRLRGCFCIVWLVGLSVQLGARASGVGGAPEHVISNVAPQDDAELTWVAGLSYGASSALGSSGDSGGNWVRRGEAHPLIYRRQRTAHRQLPARLIITMALAAVALLILRCAFPHPKPLDRGSRRSLAEWGDGFQACSSPGYPPLVSIDPGLHDATRSLLMLQEKVSGSCWRAIQKMPTLESLKTVSVLLAYATMEMTVLSGFLSDDLESQKRDVAAQLYGVARYVVQNAPRKEPHARYAYRVRRMTKLFSASRFRHAELPQMTTEERAHLLSQLLTVQHKSWNVINDALEDMAGWTRTGEGCSRESISHQVLASICAVLRIRRSHLLRIPAAVHCLDELQAAAKLKLIFGPKGLKNAAECGPLPDTQAQIEEVEQEVMSQRLLLLGTEFLLEDHEEEAEGAFRSRYLPGSRMPQQAKHVGPPLSNKFSVPFPSKADLLPAIAAAPGTQAPCPSSAFPSTDSEGRAAWKSEGCTSSRSSDKQGASQTALHLDSGGHPGWKIGGPISNASSAAQGASQAALQPNSGGRPGWENERLISNKSSATQGESQTALRPYAGGHPGGKVRDPISSTSAAAPRTSQTALRSHSRSHPGWKMEGPISSTSSPTRGASQTSVRSHSRGHPGWKIGGPISNASSEAQGALQTALQPDSGGRPGWKNEGLISNKSFATQGESQAALRSYAGGHPGGKIRDSISSTSAAPQGASQTALASYSGGHSGWMIEGSVSSVSSAPQGATQTPHHLDFAGHPGWKIGGPISSTSAAAQDSSQTTIGSHSGGHPGWKIASPVVASPVATTSSASQGTSQTALPVDSAGHPGWKVGGPISSTSLDAPGASQTTISSYYGGHSGWKDRGPISSTLSGNQAASETALHVDLGGHAGWKMDRPISSMSSAAQGASQTAISSYSGGHPGWKIGGPISSTSSAAQGASQTALHPDSGGCPGWKNEGITSSTSSATQSESQTALRSYAGGHPGGKIGGPISSTSAAAQGASQTALLLYSGDPSRWRGGGPISSTSAATQGASQTGSPLYSEDSLAWKIWGTIPSTSSATEGASRTAIHDYLGDSPGWRDDGSIASTSPATESAPQAALRHQYSLLERDSLGLLALTKATGPMESASHHWGAGDGQQDGVGSEGIFYGVPLGAPAGPWPPEGASRPDGAITSFDFQKINILVAGFGGASSEDSQGQSRQMHP